MTTSCLFASFSAMYPRQGSSADKPATQYVDFRKQVIGEEKRLGEGTRNAYATIRERVPFIEADTVMYEYMESVRQLVADGKMITS